jgi:sodium/proline symporter
MSSSSSYLLISGSAVAKNIFQGLIKRDATDRQVMIVARVTLAVVLLFDVFIAMDENSSIFQVVSYAWAGFGASFGPLMILSLYWRRTNYYGALAGMLSGAAMVFIWHELIKPLGGVFGVYELLPAFIVGLVVIVIVSLATKEPESEIDDEFDHYMEADC